MRFATNVATAFVAIATFPLSIAQVTTSCNPLTTTCPADEGLSSSSYFIDFTTITSQPSDWTLANYEYVGYGSNGAEFTFAKRYDAPTMYSNFKFFFGRIEYVAQAAQGKGIVSSMVLLSDDLDEIDWECTGTGGSKIETNYFGKGYDNYGVAKYVTVNDPQTQFHTYALDWSPTSLVWSIDGVAVRTLTPAEAGEYYPQTPMKVSLSLWDGGDPNEAVGTQNWAGGVTPIPPPENYTMYVKSIKIHNAFPAAQYEYADRSGTFQSIKVLNNTRSSSMRPSHSITSNIAPSASKASSMTSSRQSSVSKASGMSQSSSSIVKNTSNPTSSRSSVSRSDTASSVEKPATTSSVPYSSSISSSSKTVPIPPGGKVVVSTINSQASTITWVPTTYSQYRTLASTLTTSTSDTSHSSIQLVINPNGVAWTALKQPSATLSTSSKSSSGTATIVPTISSSSLTPGISVASKISMSAVNSPTQSIRSLSSMSSSIRPNSNNTLKATTSASRDTASGVHPLSGNSATGSTTLSSAPSITMSGTFTAATFPMSSMNSTFSVLAASLTSSGPVISSEIRPLISQPIIPSLTSSTPASSLSSSMNGTASALATSVASSIISSPTAPVALPQTTLDFLTTLITFTTVTSFPVTSTIIPPSGSPMQQVTTVLSTVFTTSTSTICTKYIAPVALSPTVSSKLPSSFASPTQLAFSVPDMPLVDVSLLPSAIPVSQIVASMTSPVPSTLAPSPIGISSSSALMSQIVTTAIDVSLSASMPSMAIPSDVFTPVVGSLLSGPKMANVLESLAASKNHASGSMSTATLQAPSVSDSSFSSMVSPSGVTTSTQAASIAGMPSSIATVLASLAATNGQGSVPSGSVAVQTSAAATNGLDIAAASLATTFVLPTASTFQPSTPISPLSTILSPSPLVSTVSIPTTDDHGSTSTLVFLVTVTPTITQMLIADTTSMTNSSAAVSTTSMTVESTSSSTATMTTFMVAPSGSGAEMAPTGWGNGVVSNGTTVATPGLSSPSSSSPIVGFKGIAARRVEPVGLSMVIFVGCVIQFL